MQKEKYLRITTLERPDVTALFNAVCSSILGINVDEAKRSYLGLSGKALKEHIIGISDLAKVINETGIKVTLQLEYLENNKVEPVDDAPLGEDLSDHIVETFEPAPMVKKEDPIPEKKEDELPDF